MSGIRLRKTERGFRIGEFEDLYGSRCSIQESSLATQAAIWLGVDQAFNDPNGVNPPARMHLTQTTVKALLPYLEHFAKTGRLK